MKNGALLMLLLVTAPSCTRAAHPPDSAPLQSQTLGQESDVVSTATPVAPPSEPSESETPAEQSEQITTETVSQPKGLAERYRVEGEALGGMAWVAVRNTYFVTQYVFLGDELLGWVPPGTEGRFEIPPGAHNVMLSDSKDGISNTQALAEVFDAGYSYYYDVVVR
jgi:hypothetical protein